MVDFHWKMRAHLKAFKTDYRLNVFTSIYLHRNIRWRSAVSQQGIARETGVGRTTVNDAIQWLEDRQLILPVPFHNWTQDEKNTMHHRKVLWQITGLYLQPNGVHMEALHLTPEMWMSILREIEPLDTERLKAYLRNLLIESGYCSPSEQYKNSYCSPSEQKPEGVYCSPSEHKVVYNKVKESKGTTHRRANVNSTPENPPAKGKKKTSESPSFKAEQINPMKDAIKNAFGWVKPTQSEWGLINKVARSLLIEGLTPADVQALYDYCDDRFNNFTPNALLNHVSNWRIESGAVPPPASAAPAAPAGNTPETSHTQPSAQSAQSKRPNPRKVIRYDKNS